MVKLFEASDKAMPIIFGAAGGAGGGFLDIYGSAIVSALIFAVVGGIAGFLINKLMQWCYKKCCNLFKKNKKS